MIIDSLTFPCSILELNANRFDAVTIGLEAFSQITKGTEIYLEIADLRLQLAAVCWLCNSSGEVQVIGPLARPFVNLARK